MGVTWIDALMGLVRAVLLCAFAVWVFLVTASEVVCAYKARSIRSLANVYTIGYAISVFALILVFVISPEKEGSPLDKIVLNRTMSFVAVWVIAVHSFVRGALLVLDLFEVPQAHPTRMYYERKSEHPSFACLLLGFVLGIVYLPIAGAYLLMRILEVVSRQMR